MILNFINAYVVNLSIIVATVFALYFFSLRHSLKHNDADSEFLLGSTSVYLSIISQILLGIFIGIMSFIISLNRIPIDQLRPVDVRYLPIYFSVSYGSPLIGTISTLTLITAKTFQYLYITGIPAEYWNNVILTFSILAISIIITKRKVSPKKAIILCLVLTIIIRTILLSLFLTPGLNPTILLHILIHSVIFSSLFLLTGWLFHTAFTISKEIHIYRTSSTFDKLTGLYNQESFYFFLDLTYNEAIQKGHRFSLAIIDFDDFKGINDTYGHLAGDHTLQKVASIFKNKLSPNSRIRVCRIGGDEFGIIFKHEDYDALKFIKDCLREIEATSKRMPLYKQQITLSIGLVDFYPEEISETDSPALTVQDLFSLADATLYEAKKQGKDQIKFIEKVLYIQKKDQTMH
ncbi:MULTISPECIES: GGDEF domain-containing protein [Vagococcus]|uniref:Diguanylate cyclase/phosphodiesterase (GGDEF & EAL domains) with PAS/PAC sensor(S) n=1 Tax=Vagococcus fluvialis bH819 TaxID=1255619 RepID=A0A1X6WK00_9ENTE|nr:MULTISPECIES: GGDEF domain-containing protein [Vagococcus]SLM84595.1 diguanylate cyclase/phosphodiesterase (GGDEF & EAL domains) with PAS/PAC sensor(s) [Vagococcus fluvialis bH819]HCM89941.1 GGDEF domain-containing protein [Vagococcus sp.]